MRLLMSTKWAVNMHTLYGDELYNDTINIIGEIVKECLFTNR